VRPARSAFDPVGYHPGPPEAIKRQSSAVPGGAEAGPAAPGRDLDQQARPPGTDPPPDPRRPRRHLLRPAGGRVLPPSPPDPL